MAWAMGKIVSYRKALKGRQAYAMGYIMSPLSRLKEAKEIATRR